MIGPERIGGDQGAAEAAHRIDDLADQGLSHRLGCGRGGELDLNIARLDGFVIVKLEVADRAHAVGQREDLAIDKVRTVTRDGQHTIKQLGLEPVIKDATGSPVGVTIQLGRRAVGVANHVVAIDTRAEVQTQIVIPL